MQSGYVLTVGLSTSVYNELCKVNNTRCMFFCLNSWASKTIEAFSTEKLVEETSQVYEQCTI